LLGVRGKLQFLCMDVSTVKNFTCPVLCVEEGGGISAAEEKNRGNQKELGSRKRHNGKEWE
jgi:hypothetical protein